MTIKFIGDVNLQLQERTKDMENECEILKKANEELVSRYVFYVDYTLFIFQSQCFRTIKKMICCEEYGGV